MKEKDRIANVVNSKFYPLLLFFVSFIFVTLFSRSTSFLYVFEGADPSVFKQMGRAVLQGKTMYVDYFDNKGCLLYFIHALGLWLGGNTALLVMQAISLTVTMLIWDKMLALFRSPRQRLTSLIVALFLLFCFYGAGDQTQEWCLLFVSYPLLVFLRAYHSETKIQPLQMLTIGLCFGIITFIQVNNACAFLGFLAYIWIQYLFGKHYRKLLSSIMCFFAGWTIIAIPCMLYFYIEAGWVGIHEMVYASFLSNLEYMQNQWRTRWIHFIPYSLFILSFVSLQVVDAFYCKDKKTIFPFILSMILFVGTFGHLCNAFYLQAIIPLCIVGLTSFSFKEKKMIKIGLTFTMLFSLSFYVLNNGKDLVLQNKMQLANYTSFHRCFEAIPEIERDSIYNYNLYWYATSMMEHEKILLNNRVLYSTLVFTLPTLREEEAKKNIIPPKWMLLSFDKEYIEEDKLFILENYEQYCSFIYNYQVLDKPRIGDRFQVSLYRRKE